MIFKLTTILLIVCFSTACSNPNVFGKKTLHERYSDKIKRAGLDQTVLGQQWLRAAEKALTQPQSITIPYKEKGYFLAEKPQAYSLKIHWQKRV